MKIIVSVFNNLYTDQRVEKVCETLHKQGYEIHLIGSSWDGSPPMERPYSFERIALHSKILKFAYVEFNKKLYQRIIQLADKNTILLANDLDTLLPNVSIANRLHIPLVYDSHEIFTEMPSLQGRWTQKIWRFLERRLMPNIKWMITASESYAQWFENQYNIKSLVIRNFPKKINTKIDFSDNQPKIILYQGQINPSRGIPKVIEAMEYLDNAILKIAGDGPKRKEYEALVKEKGLTDKVEFLGRLAPKDLRKITQKADVGLSIEENGGISYYYSLPNKVSDYIQSKVPLVSINFPEMKKIQNAFKVGEMIENHQPQHIAEKIKMVLDNGRAFYQSELEKASAVFCWEQEEEKLKAFYQEISQGK